MISDDLLTQIAAITTLTSQDIEDLRACDPNQVATLIRTYVDMGKVADRGVWVQVANILKEAGEYAPLASMIIGIIGVL